MAKETIKYEIIRTDLFPSQEALQATFDEYVANGLDLEEEIKKLIWLGYIKEAK